MHGIELSPYMTERLRAQHGLGSAVTIGDLAAPTWRGDSPLASRVRDKITNLTTQDEQFNSAVPSLPI